MTKLSTIQILVVSSGPEVKYCPLCESFRRLFGAEIIFRSVDRSKGFLARILRRCLGKIKVVPDRSMSSEIARRKNRIDLLVVIKGNYLDPVVLKEIGSWDKAPYIVGITNDDMALAHNNTALFRKGAQYYDIIYTSKSLNIENNELNKMGFKKVRFFYQRFDKFVHRPIPSRNNDAFGKVVFVGSGELMRYRYLNYAAKNGVEVHVWGNNWPRWMKFLSSSNLIFHGESKTETEYAAILSSAAICCGFLRKKNRDRHTSRTIEIPACGAFMLAEYTDEHASLFVPDAEAVFFDGKDDFLRKLIRYYGDQKLRDSIRLKGYLRCQLSKYTYDELAVSIVDDLTVD